MNHPDTQHIINNLFEKIYELETENHRLRNERVLLIGDKQDVQFENNCLNYQNEDLKILNCELQDLIKKDHILIEDLKKQIEINKNVISEKDLLIQEKEEKIKMNKDQMESAFGSNGIIDLSKIKTEKSSENLLSKAEAIVQEMFNKDQIIKQLEMQLSKLSIANENLKNAWKDAEETQKMCKIGFETNFNTMKNTFETEIDKFNLQIKGINKQLKIHQEKERKLKSEIEDLKTKNYKWSLFSRRLEIDLETEKFKLIQYQNKVSTNHQSEKNFSNSQK